MDKITMILRLIPFVDGVMKFLDGKKTYIAALGLAALGVYQATQGNWDGAYQSLLGFLAAVGLRSAVAKVETKVPAQPLDLRARSDN